MATLVTDKLTDSGYIYSRKLGKLNVKQAVYVFLSADMAVTNKEALRKLRKFARVFDNEVVCFICNISMALGTFVLNLMKRAQNFANHVLPNTVIAKNHCKVYYRCVQ